MLQENPKYNRNWHNPVIFYLTAFRTMTSETLHSAAQALGQLDWKAGMNRRQLNMKLKHVREGVSARTPPYYCHYVCMYATLMSAVGSSDA